MKRTNLYLSIGLLIVVFFMTMMTFPGLFTEKSPYDISGVEGYRTEEGNYSFRTPPFEPGQRFVLGSDDSGRDVLSFIIYGAKLTLTIGLSVAVLRFVLGLVLGIGSALDNQLSTLLVNQFNNVFNAIPPLIICIIVLSIGYLKALPKTYSILVFIVVMTLVEWARVAVFIRERTEVILNKDFVKSERIIGKHNGAIILENVLPHLFSELIVLFFMEISRVLTLMMQLGIFGIFIGNLKIVADTGPGVIVGKMTSYEPEWASMLGSSKNYIRVAPWIVSSCALAFFFSVLGFNFVGEGLRMLHQEGRKIFNTKKQQLLVLGLLLCVAAAGIAGTYEPSMAIAEVEEGWMTLQEESLPGTDQNIECAEAIAEKLSYLGLKPTKESYLYPYDVQPYYHVEKADLFVDTEALSYGIDEFGLLSYQSVDQKGPVIDLRGVSLIDADLSDDPFRKRIANKFVVMDGDFFNGEGQLFFSERLIRETDILGVLIPVDHPTEKLLGLTTFDKPVIAIKRSQIEALIGREIRISIESEVLSGKGMNIVGQIQSPVATEETKGILLGFNYNFMDPEVGRQQLNFAMDLIASLKANEEHLKRNITVIFWDGAYEPEISGMNSYYSEYYYPIKHTLVYIDMTRLFNGKGSGQSIMFNDDYITLAKPDTFSLSTYLIGTLGDSAMGKKDLKDTYSVFYHKRGIQVLYLGTNGKDIDDKVLTTLEDALLETLIKEIY